MVALILENICLPGTARILIDFSTGASSDPTAVVSLPSTYLQEWQDQPVATKRITLRSETGGVVFNSSPWLRHIISWANPESEQNTYRWTDNGNTTLRPIDSSGSLYVNRAETTDPTATNPHTNNLFFSELESGEKVGWVDAVSTNTTPTTLVITGLVAATTASIGAGITLNRYDNSELTYVTSIPITAAGAIGPYTVNITIPDDYWVVVFGFENAVIVGGFTVTQSWNCGTGAACREGAVVSHITKILTRTIRYLVSPADREVLRPHAAVRPRQDPHARPLGSHQERCRRYPAGH